MIQRNPPQRERLQPGFAGTQGQRNRGIILLIGEVGSGGLQPHLLALKGRDGRTGLKGQAAGYPDALSNWVQHPPFLKFGDHLVP